MFRSCRFAGLFAVTAALALMGAETPASRAGGDVFPGSVGPAANWQPWFEAGGYVSSEDERAEVTLWVPLWQDGENLVFTDLRGNLFDDDVREGNFALGYRAMLGSGWNVGAFGSFDIRETQFGNTFRQASIGLEALHPWIDIRANAYLPLTGPKIAQGQAQVFVIGNQIGIFGAQEVALQGVDAEIGTRVDLGFGDVASGAPELRVYAGGYYFNSKDALEDIAGPKLRAELRFLDFLSLPGARLTLNAAYSWDEVRENTFEGGLRVRIPLGAVAGGSNMALAARSPQSRRMMDRVERDTDIVIGQSGRESVSDDATGTNLDRVAVVDGTGNLQQTINANGANSLIIVQGGAGNLLGGVTVAGDQTVQGGGSTIQLRGRTSGGIASYTAPGSKPTVAVGGGTDVLTLAGNNTHIVGLGIDGLGQTSRHGIFGDGNKSNIVIDQNMIMNAGNTGVRFVADNSNIRILGNMISGTGTRGVRFGNRNNDITVSSNSIANSGNTAVQFGGQNNNLTVAMNTITMPSLDGIEFSNNNSNVRIDGNTITGAGRDGVTLNNNNTDIWITNTTITNASSDGITLNNGNERVTIDGVTISGNASEGIDFENRNTDITIANTTITNSGTDAIAFNNNNERVTISNVSIFNSQNDGIVFVNDNSTVLISGVLISGTQFEGIEFDNRNSGITIRDTRILNARETAVEFDDNNTNVLVSNVTIDGVTTEEGFFADNNNSITIENSTIRNVSQQGIEVDNGNTLIVRNNRIENTGGDAIDIGANNNVTIAGNVFAGTIGDDLLDVNGGGTNTLSGAGNTTAPGIVITDRTCEANGGGNLFAGQIVLDGVTLQDNVAPCN